MINDDNVLIRCPNGHELQTAKADMHKKLACPICSTIFSPADGQASPGGAAGTMTDPHVLDLAAGRLGQPVTYPAYTNWMLAAWIISTVVQAGGTVFQHISPPQTGGQWQNPTAAVGAMGLSCMLGAIALTAIVMQLMWIYRIHADARRAGQYDGASPGLALGLSFIPAFNYIWTALLMSRLARFSASADAADEPAEAPAIKATKINLVFSFFLGCSCLVTGAYGAKAFLESMRLAMGQGGQPLTPELQRQITESATPPTAWTIASVTLSIIAVCVYAWAVRKMERSLYPRLGALEP